MAHPTAFTRPQSKPTATQKPAKRQRIHHWVIDGRQKLTVPVEFTVDIVCDGCLLKDHSPPLHCHVLGWDDTLAVCGARRSRGEVHLCMLPTSELPHATIRSLRDAKQRLTALRPYQDPVCTTDGFVEAVFQRPAVNPGEEQGREEPVLHIVKDKLSGYSCSKVRSQQPSLNNFLPGRGVAHALKLAGDAASPRGVRDLGPAAQRRDESPELVRRDGAGC